MSLTEEYARLIEDVEEKPELANEIAKLVLSAPVTPESTGLLALIYHDGVGLEPNLDKSFELAEKAAFEGKDPLGYYLLGYMCDNVETPNQADGGPRQKFDQYDAEHFYEICSKTDSVWAPGAHLWLGDHYMDMARGGDPEVAVQHYEAIGKFNAEAAGKLSDYYWEQLEIESFSPEKRKELEKKVYYWTLTASELNPHDYSYRMGCCYAEGIDCDKEKGFRLARKYWEDAYGFGDWRAADAIAMLYEKKLNNLPDDAPEFDRFRCQREIASWRKLAQRTREREWAKEHDNCAEED